MQFRSTADGSWQQFQLDCVIVTTAAACKLSATAVHSLATLNSNIQKTAQPCWRYTRAPWVCKHAAARCRRT